MMFQQAVREDIEILYSFKKVLTNVYFDPGLSGNLFESLYRFLKSRRSVKITYFYFNDESKYIDVKFENSMYQDCHTQIVKGMINAFREIVFDQTLYNRLYFINPGQAEWFKAAIVDNNYINILGLAFDCLLLKNTPEEVIYRIKLV